jgi:hypothetical protein
MNIRLLYASIMSLFALFTGYYAVMTLAFFFGENRSEWVFPVIITAVAALVIWTAVALWSGRDAVYFTGASALVVAASTLLIIVPPGGWSAAFAGIVLVALLAVGLLAGLGLKTVRKALR